jgi:hypothetical protein
MKWGTKYGATYVNRLYGMVSRHLAGPFGFVCLTDDAAGVRPEVTCAPIPALPAYPTSPERGWAKIAAFSPTLAPLLVGPVLFLDLDVVIVGDLDPLFDEPGQFLIIRDWYHPMGGIGNSSVFRYDLAAGAGLFADFGANVSTIVRRHRNEQEYLTHWMRDAGVLAFWPAAWCRSFRRDCIPPWPLRFWRTPAAPKGSRVLVFHGDPKPPEAIAGQGGVVGFSRPAPWLAEAWRA